MICRAPCRWPTMNPALWSSAANIGDLAAGQVPFHSWADGNGGGGGVQEPILTTALTAMVETVTAARLFPSTRLGLALIGFFGILVVYALRIDINVTIVCMVNRSHLLNSSEPLTLADEGEFEWSKELQGYILGAFYWGYLFTQVLGGWAAQRVGARLVLGGSVLVGAVITLFTPLFSRHHVGALIASRVLLGFCQGVTFPAFHTFWSGWAPPLERSKLTGITYAGGQVGNVVTLPLAGVLCDYGFAGGWPSVFYVLGMIGLVWTGLWALFARDSPRQHPGISAKEKEYIVSSLAEQNGKQSEAHPKVPWLAIFKSLPVWAAIAGHFAGDWGAYIMMTCLPSFMKEVLKFDMTSLGFLASIPYIAYFLCINIAGFLADFLRSRGLLSTRNTRKAAMTLALTSQAVFLVSAGHCSEGQETLVIIFLTLGMGLSGFQYAGFIVNYMDIAPRYAGTLLGIGNTLSCICGILAPYAMGIITADASPEAWRTLFWLTAAILLAGVLIFDIFADGVVQPWALEEDGEEMKELQEKKPQAPTDSDLDAHPLV